MNWLRHESRKVFVRSCSNGQGIILYSQSNMRYRLLEPWFIYIKNFKALTQKLSQTKSFFFRPYCSSRRTRKRAQMRHTKCILVELIKHHFAGEWALNNVRECGIFGFWFLLIRSKIRCSFCVCVFFPIFSALPPLKKVQINKKRKFNIKCTDIFP